eukprot:1182661-Prorocentrum_minimum.AAC.2
MRYFPDEMRYFPDEVLDAVIVPRTATAAEPTHCTHTLYTHATEPTRTYSRLVKSRIFPARQTGV